MGKVYSHMIRRPAQNFNLEQRAMKELSKMEHTKPSPAPRHPSSTQYIDKAAEENPHIANEVKGSNETLITNMEKLLASPEKMGEIVNKRALPVNRKPQADLEYGYEEPESFPEGKLSIKQTMELLSMHHTDPVKYSPENIARQYKLEKDKVDNLIKYFHIFQIHMPVGSKAAELLESPNFGAKPGFLKGAVDKLLPDSTKKPSS